MAESPDRLNILQKLLEGGKLVASAGPTIKSPKALEQLGARIYLSGLPSATVLIGEADNEKSLNELPVTVTHIDGQALDSQKPESGAHEVALDTTRVSLEDKVGELDMRFSLTDEQTHDQLHAANRGFDDISNAQFEVLRVKHDLEALRFQVGQARQEIKGIQETMQKELNDGKISDDTQDLFNSINATLGPQLTALEQKGQEKDNLYIQKTNDLRSAIQEHSERKNDDEDAVQLEKLDTEVVKQALRRGRDRFRKSFAEKQDEKSLEQVVVPEGDTNDPRHILALAIKAIEGDAPVSKNLQTLLAQTFPNVQIVSDTGALLPVGVMDAVEGLMTHRIGAHVSGDSMPFAAFVQEVKPDEKFSAIPKLLAQARAEIKAQREKIANTPASSLQLWNEEQRRMLLTGRGDVFGYGSIETHVVFEGGGPVQSKDDRRDALFTSFDRLSFSEKQLLANTLVPPKEGARFFGWHFYAKDIAENGYIDFYSNANFAKTVSGGGTMVSLFDVHRAVEAEMIQVKHLDTNFIDDVKTKVNKLIGSDEDPGTLSRVDHALHERLKAFNQSIQSARDSGEIIAAIRSLSPDLQEKCNDLVHGSTLLYKINEQQRSIHHKTESMQLVFDADAPEAAGITIEAVGWKSPLLETFMKDEDITAIGTSEEPFRLTITPDQRIVITGPNANGKTVFAQMLTAAMMGYPVLADKFVIRGSSVAFEKIREGFRPHFQSPHVSGLSTFQNVAVGLRQGLHERLPIYDESVGGTTSEYQKKINAVLLATAPQISVLHGAAETLELALQLDPTLSETILPIQVEGYKPVQGTVARTSGGLQLVSRTVPTPDTLTKLAEEVLELKQANPESRITFAMDPDIRTISEYLHTHRSELEVGDTRGEEFFAELGFHGDEGGIFWLKKTLMRTALQKQGFTLGAIEQMGRLLSDETETLLIERALQDHDLEKATGRRGIVEYFMRQQGAQLPQFMKTVIGQLPRGMRTSAEKYLNSLDTTGSPYDHALHMATLLRLPQARWSEIEFFLKDRTFAHMDPYQLATFKGLLPQNDAVFERMTSATQKLVALRDMPLDQALSSIGDASIRTNLRDRYVAVLQNAEAGLTKEAKDDLVWLETVAVQKETAQETIRQAIAPTAKAITKAILGDVENEVVAQVLEADITTMLGYVARVDTYGIRGMSFIEILQNDKTLKDPQVFAIVKKWMGHIYPDKDNLPLRPWAWDGVSAHESIPEFPPLNETQKKEIHMRMGLVVAVMFPGNGLIKQELNDAKNKSVYELFGNWKKNKDRLQGDFQHLETIRQREARINPMKTWFERMKKIDQTSEFQDILAQSDIAPWQQYFKTEFQDVVKFYRDLLNTSDIPRAIAAQANNPTLGNIATGLDSLKNQRLLRELLVEQVTQAVQAKAKEAFGGVEVNAREKATQDIGELLSLAGYARMYRELGISTSQSKVGDEIKLTDMTNIATIAQFVAKQVFSQNLDDSERVQQTIQAAVGKFMKSKSLQFVPGVTHFISGGNGNGKSTMVQGVGAAAILSHMTGFAPAAEAKLPDFKHILFVRGGETTASMSKFTASLSAMNDMLRTIDQYPNEPTLILMDEIGTGTNPTEARVIKQAVHRVLAEHPNITIIVVDQEQDAWKRLKDIEKPTSVMSVNDNHVGTQTDQMVDPKSIDVLTAGTIGDYRQAPFMPPIVAQLFKSVSAVV